MWPPVSLTQAENMPLGKIAASLDDTAPVVHFDLRISPQIFKQICDAPNVIVRDSWEDDSWKKTIVKRQRPEARAEEEGTYGLNFSLCSFFFYSSWNIGPNEKSFRSLTLFKEVLRRENQGLKVYPHDGSTVFSMTGTYFWFVLAVLSGLVKKKTPEAGTLFCCHSSCAE
jgi:hypothetical protein